ncbi:MAG: ESX secretion-associated protein EspG [Nocardia sp.]|nr:ESX secretion-associated protein EspG [Nocardia sp.]
MNSWTLTDLEFKVLCDMRLFGMLPRPFVITSRIPLMEDYERACKRTRSELEQRMDSELEAVVDTMALPDVLVTAQSWDEADFEDPTKRVRVYAGTRGSRGFITVQNPGETIWHAEGFTITSCDPRALGDRVAGLFPTVEAGRRESFAIATGEEGLSQHTYSMNAHSMVADEEEVFTAQRFFTTPATCAGSIRLTQGRSRFGPRGRITTALAWRDLAGDGRYVAPLDTPDPWATGMGTTGLAAWVDTEIANVIERMDDYQEVDE